MKKICVLLVFVLLICMCVPVCAERDNGVWRYEVKGGKVQLTGYMGAEKIKKLEFPSEIEGYPVTVIGDGNIFLWLNEVGQRTELIFPETTEVIKGPFFTLGYFGKVVIPASVKTIGNGAFQVASVSEVVFEGAPETFEDFAFASDFELKSIKIPEGTVSLGKNCFNLCDGLTSVSIPSTLQTMGASCFSGCARLKEVTFAPNCQLKIIPKGCFISSSIRSIDIPNEVTTIDTNAFYDCTKLTAVTLPQSVEYIASDAFSNCTANPTFTVVEGSYAHRWVEQRGLKMKVKPAPIELPEGAEENFRELSPGCEGDDVFAVRMKMYELGYFRNVPNQRDYTNTMKDYVKKFERDYQLEVDGILTPYEQAVLFSAQ